MPPRFRADQVGSLIRPASLLEARKSHDIYSDSLSDDLTKATSAAITDVARKQLDVSIRPITTGEYERTIFFSGFFENLEGMTTRHDLRILEDFRPGLPTTEALAKMGRKEFSGVIATSKIKHVSSAYLSGWEMLKQAVPQQYWNDCKLCIPSITWQHMYLGNKAYESRSYESDEDYLGDLAAAFRAELKVLYDAGLRSVQVDDPNLTFFVVESYREQLRRSGVDPDELLDLYCWAQNEALKGRPADLHVGVHLCRGNVPKAPSFAEGSYETIAKQVFTKLDYDTFYLEFDGVHSGGFEPLRFIPKGKNVVLGIVSTKVPELEDSRELESRVREAATVIANAQGRTADEVLNDSLAVSPQCGFASHSENRGVDTEERMWEKLKLVRDLARKIWEDAV